MTAGVDKAVDMAAAVDKAADMAAGVVLKNINIYKNVNKYSY